MWSGWPKLPQLVTLDLNVLIFITATTYEAEGMRTRIEDNLFPLKNLLLCTLACLTHPREWWVTMGWAGTIPSCHWQRNRPRRPNHFAQSHTMNMLGRPGTDISSAVCFVNTTLSITFFSEKRKWDQNKGLRQKLFTPTSSLPPNTEGEPHIIQRLLKPLLRCQNLHERHSPLSEWLTCFVWTKEISWPFSKHYLYLGLHLGLPHLKKLRYSVWVWIALPPSGCPGESKQKRWEGKSQGGLSL